MGMDVEARGRCDEQHQANQVRCGLQHFFSFLLDFLMGQLATAQAPQVTLVAVGENACHVAEPFGSQ